MTQQWQERWTHWRRRLLHSLLHERVPHENLAGRVAMLAAVGTAAMPLYYLLWHFFFPQAYENLALRLTGVGICAAGLFARRFSSRWLSRYLLFALSYILPFFFTFMFLMNQASSIWSESLLIGAGRAVSFRNETGLPRLPDRHQQRLPRRYPARARAASCCNVTCCSNCPCTGSPLPRCPS